MLTASKQLIVFGEDWGRYPSSTQYLIVGLLKLGWQVVWINSIGMRASSFRWFYIKRCFNKLIQSIKTKITNPTIIPGLTVVNPLIIPIIGNPIIDYLNMKILNKQIQGIVKEKHFLSPIIWTSLPTAYPYFALFPKGPFVYYCGDDFTVFPGVSSEKITELEHKLIQKVDLIFVSSEILAKKMPDDKTVFIDHGVDLVHFQKKYKRPCDLVEGKPIAGFYGHLSDWVDVDLIYKSALKLSEWNFVFIGPKEISLKKLEQLDNFFYLGPKSYEEIPAYSQHWQVNLLPFVRNQLTDAINPLKIKEYLASGKPVVSIDLPSIDRYKKLIYIVNNAQQFIQAIEAALEDKRAAVRKHAITKDSWDNRASSLEPQLIQLLEKTCRGNIHG